MQGLCLNEKITLGELYRKVNEGLSGLSNKYLIGEGDISLFGDKIDAIWERICSRRNPNGTYGFQWKFPTLNNYCPIEKGELIVVSGQEKKGKSTVMLNQLAYSIQNNIPCLYVDTELQEEGFFIRLLSCFTKIPAHKIKSGNYSPSEEQMIEETKMYLKKIPFAYKYLPEADMDVTYSLCKTLQYKINLQLVFFDYIKDVESKDNSSQYNRLGYMTNFLKNEIAGTLDLAVIAGAQLNRHEEIADSIKIARYASTILKVSFKDEKRIAQDGEDCGNYMLWVDINRNGDWHNFDDGEYIDLLFKGDIFTVEETAKQHEQPLPF
jgi:replicative DNA helicase